MAMGTLGARSSKRSDGCALLFEQDLDGVFAVERSAPAEAFVAEGCQRVDVARGSRCAACRALGRDVARAAEDCSCPGGNARILVRFGAGDSEVEHLHEVWIVTASHEHRVFRLQVSVHDTTLVGFAERVGDLK